MKISSANHTTYNQDKSRGITDHPITTRQLNDFIRNYHAATAQIAKGQEKKNDLNRYIHFLHSNYPDSFTKAYISRLLNITRERVGQIISQVEKLKGGEKT